MADSTSDTQLKTGSNQVVTLDEIAARAEKLLYDLFYEAMEAGADEVLQYQFDKEPAYRHRYAKRCINNASNELADLLIAYKAGKHE